MQHPVHVRFAVTDCPSIATTSLCTTHCTGYDSTNSLPTSNIELYLHDSTNLSYPHRTSSCAQLQLDHTSYRHLPSSWRPHRTAMDFAHTFVIPTINCPPCCICYLAFVSFIVFGCHYSHALNLIHLWGRHAYRLRNRYSLFREKRTVSYHLLTQRVSFKWHFEAKGVWKKFSSKFEFQWGPVCRIVKTSYREKEIFDTRYRCFFLVEETFCR